MRNVYGPLPRSGMARVRQAVRARAGHTDTSCFRNNRIIIITLTTPPKKKKRGKENAATFQGPSSRRFLTACLAHRLAQSEYEIIFLRQTCTNPGRKRRGYGPCLGALRSVRIRCAWRCLLSFVPAVAPHRGHSSRFPFAWGSAELHFISFPPVCSSTAWAGGQREHPHATD